MLHSKNEQGFTLVEVTIILLVLAILGAIMVPNIGDYLFWARYARAKEDLNALCSSMAKFLHDTGESAFYRDGQGGHNTPDRDEPIGLLIGDGDIPDPNVEGPDSFWRNVIDEDFDVYTDLLGDDYEFETDTFANHLIKNQPVFSPNRHYRTPAETYQGSPSSGKDPGMHFDPEEGEGFNSLFAWRGPYINDRVVPDPWGNRYMSNVFALFQPKENGGPTYGFDGYNSAVVCYTAGPDEEVDTEFNQPLGWITGDDDMTAILHGGNW